jgi:hypothetical protein
MIKMPEKDSAFYWKHMDSYVPLDLDINSAKTIHEFTTNYLSKNQPKDKEITKAAITSWCRSHGIDERVQTQASYVEAIPIGVANKKITEDDKYLHTTVTMAAQMVQDYHISELWWMADALPDDTEFIPIFKDYQELKKMIVDLKTRHIDSIPFVMPHTNAIFLKEQIPTKLKDQMNGIDPKEVCGYCDNFSYDDKHTKVRADIHMDKKKCGDVASKLVREGGVMSVSIGFICDFDLNANSHNGKHYLGKQIDLQLGHLAGIMEGSGKCPIGTCGINQDTNRVSRLQDSWIKTDLPVSVAQAQPSPKVEFIPKAVELDGSFKKENHQIQHSTQIKGKIIMTEAELQAELLKVKSELDASRSTAAQTQVVALTNELKDTKTELGAKISVIALKDKEIADLNTKVSDLSLKVKEIEDKEASDNRSFLVTQYGSLDYVIPVINKKVRDLCIKELRITRGAIEGALDSKLKSNGLPKTDGTADVNQARLNEYKAQLASDSVNGPPKVEE